jgi:DNA invertase Pin-like site-specific DNA recombinase
MDGHHICEHNGISGTKGHDQRLGLDAVLKDASRARFDVVTAWALDRRGRSLRTLMDTLQDLESANVGLFLHQQAIDTTTPAGRVFFHILGAFIKFEYGTIRSWVNAGLGRARAKGVRLVRPKVSKKIEGTIRKHLAAGEGMLKVAKALGVGVSPVQRVKAEMPAAAAG